MREIDSALMVLQMNPAFAVLCDYIGGLCDKEAHNVASVDSDEVATSRMRGRYEAYRAVYRTITKTVTEEE